MMAFFIFINCVFLLAVGAEVPHIVFIVLRVFGGTCVALVIHIEKGFTLYDELSIEELSSGRDSEALYFARLICLGICVVFTTYLCTSCVCLCCIGGIDGSNVRNVRNPNRMFKRVPFGNLVF